MRLGKVCCDACGEVVFAVQLAGSPAAVGTWPLRFTNETLAFGSYPMNHSGTERRVHKVYVTRNTEYHLREGVCVAVRDRHSGGFHSAHIALSLKLQGAVRIYSNGGVIPQANEPEAGDAIYFTYIRPDGEERQIVTSRLLSVERPPHRVVQSYPLLHPATARRSSRQSHSGA